MRRGCFGWGLMTMERISIEPFHLVSALGTSDGAQDKYYKNGYWYKTDYFGGEGYNEAFVSKILSCTNLAPDRYVQYQEIEINGKAGCLSKSFLHDNEEFISIYRLHKNICGTDISTLFRKMDYDDQVDYLTQFIKRETGIHYENTLAQTFFIDNLTLNSDRHLNNLGLIFKEHEFSETPIFDNGKSFFCGDKRFNSAQSISENARHICFRPFTASIQMMLKTFPSNIEISWLKMRKMLSEEPNSLAKQVLLTRLQPILEKDIQYYEQSRIWNEQKLHVGISSILQKEIMDEIHDIDQEVTAAKDVQNGVFLVPETQELKPFEQER